MPAKSERQLEEEGYTYAGLFGEPTSNTLRLLNRLLKPYGVKIVSYGNYAAYGDATWLKVIPLDPSS